MAAKILKNQTVSPITIIDVGNVTVPGSGQYVIPPEDYLIWAASSDIVTQVGSGDIVVSDSLKDLNKADGISLIQFGHPQFLSTSPKIYNKAITLAATEESQVLTNGTKRFTIRVRGYSSLKLAFVSGESGTNYITIPRGCSMTSDWLDVSDTLYFQTDKANQVVEILEWS